MSEPVHSQEPQKTYTPAQNNRHRWITFSFIALFLLLGLAYLVYWFWWGQFSESTDDAYVNGNMIMLTPQEEGIIIRILADNTQLVEPGQLVLELDPHDFEIAFEERKADLANTVRQVAQMFIKVDELEAKLETQKGELLKANLDYWHRQPLVLDGSVSKEEFEHSQIALFVAYATLREIENELKAAKAEVEKTRIETHPLVEEAKARVKKAFLSLHRCKVLSPVRGIVTLRKAQVGQKVLANDSLMAIVPVDEIWVDANFREVSLKNIRIGQKVKLVADMYGGDIKYHGRVVGLNPGTGSVFSILPPQNATGNWIKIIQRIPVKISFDPEEIKQYPLVLGLSMTVSVDTHKRSGLRLPEIAQVQPIYCTDVYSDELNGIDEIIDGIVRANRP